MPFAVTLSRIIFARPKRAAFAAGALLTLSLPPVGFWPVIFLAYPLFYIAISTAVTVRQGAARGFCFGAGYFICGLYWISGALFVDIGMWWWVLPFSLIALPCVFAIYPALAGALFTRFRRHDTYADILFLSVLLAVMDYARGHLFTGFPWNIAGYAWSENLVVMQSAAVLGVYGLGLFTYLVGFAGLALLIPPYAFMRRGAYMGFVLTLSVAVCVYGLVRLNAPDTQTDTTVRIVQPSIPQNMKWEAARENDNLMRIIALSRESADESTAPPSLVIWPESALTFDPQTPGLMGLLSDMMPDTLILTGTVRSTQQPDDSYNHYNSLVAIDTNTGTVRDAFDKFHLVPFGEYIPFQDILRMAPIAGSLSKVSGFTPGAGPRSIAIDALPPFSALICYEVIFPGAVTSSASRPAWLLNVTNDAWYGHSAGPYQHLEIARMRAIEEGLPVIRAANNGVSAVIAPSGRIVAALPLNAVDVLDVSIPSSVPAPLYARFKDLFFILFAGVVLVFGLRTHNQ